MAIQFASKTNVDMTDPDFPLGKILDDTGVGDGTPVNVEVYGDFHQFFAKLLADAGITANDLPDNDTNGYEYINALNKQIGRNAWTSASIAFTIPAAAGGGSVGSITVHYNKYRIVGKTLNWQVRFTATITGTVSAFTISSPSADVTSYVNTDMDFAAIVSGAAARVSLTGFSGPGQITIGMATGNIPAGAQVFNINITAEIS